MPCHAHPFPFSLVWALLVGVDLGIATTVCNLASLLDAPCAGLPRLCIPTAQRADPPCFLGIARPSAAAPPPHIHLFGLVDPPWARGASSPLLACTRKRCTHRRTCLPRLPVTPFLPDLVYSKRLRLLPSRRGVRSTPCCRSERSPSCVVGGVWH